MTTNEKFSLLRSRGLKWADIAAFLGVSRQFISEVRLGRKKLSEEKERMVDEMVKDCNRNHDDNRNQDPGCVSEHATQYAAAPTRKQDDIQKRLEALELDMKLVKQMLLNDGLIR